MRKLDSLAILGLVSLLLTAEAWAQTRPYIGFVYPAGGRQGTTFAVKIGGQNLGGVDRVVVNGSGVSVKVVEYFSPLGPLEMGLLGQQLRDLKRPKSARRSTMSPPVAATTSDPALMISSPAASGKTPAGTEAAASEMIDRLEKRMRETQNRPACAALRFLAFLEVTIAPDAAPGERELRVVTPKGGPSNALPFHIGQLPEYTRKPMLTAQQSVLGKEELALRKRPPDEVEDRIEVPSTLNGQVASGEINRYRFDARKGQRLVIRTLARHLIPYVADAVPGWFQPILTLYDANGKEVAYNDDYRFQPDPVISYEVPKDGQYVLAITDAIYRGREDFVYRVTIGEVPMVTSIFPLGGRAGEVHAARMQGWNLVGAEMALPGKDAGAGLYRIAASKAGVASNEVRYAVDTLPECVEKEGKEGNDSPAKAQKIALPVIINGRMNRPDDWDVFRFEGKAGQKLVAEVVARRLDSPLDSVLKITDAAGKILAYNDDHQDLGAGVNTHHADSYLMLELPADGTYYVHLGDTAGNGGEEYGYRLRISQPRPDFALRVVPSSVALRPRSSAMLTVYAIRKDGFNAPIKLGLKDPPKGFSASTVVLPDGQPLARLAFKALQATGQPVSLTVEGRATVAGEEIVHQAVPAEDRMQAFLWRHLVPAQDLAALVFDPSYEPPVGRVPPQLTEAQRAKAKAIVAAAETAGRKFTKGQVMGRVRSIKALYQQGLLTDEFYGERVAECGLVD